MRSALTDLITEDNWNDENSFSPVFDQSVSRVRPTLSFATTMLLLGLGLGVVCAGSDMFFASFASATSTALDGASFAARRTTSLSAGTASAAASATPQVSAASAPCAVSKAHVKEVSKKKRTR